ncbi:hypothetical protein P691DRAFT_800369 [Macrolepiota fuliginosa MF-IS2]|uniref:Uncharacterized protein n=1 Tax=Macrolepiota fuliginosa MF-IS2 TaxID=1400762 RepID=A0A9P5X029_9AGAR|nr:hypothetical protein P691DRAFT_800369 [Macrolepiota fuliginosa MF-IS2]
MLASNERTKRKGGGNRRRDIDQRIERQVHPTTSAAAIYATPDTPAPRPHPVLSSTPSEAPKCVPVAHYYQAGLFA